MNSTLPWHVLLWPLVSAVSITLFLRRSRALSSLVSVAAVIASFVCSWLIFLQPNIVATEQTWIEIPGIFRVPLGFTWDSLRRMMLLVVTGVGSLIHIYSVG